MSGTGSTSKASGILRGWMPSLIHSWNIKNCIHFITAMWNDFKQSHHINRQFFFYKKPRYTCIFLVKSDLFFEIRQNFPKSPGFFPVTSEIRWIICLRLWKKWSPPGVVRWCVYSLGAGVLLLMLPNLAIFTVLVPKNRLQFSFWIAGEVSGW